MKNLRVSVQSYIDLGNVENKSPSLSAISSNTETLCDLNPDNNEFYLWRENYVHIIASQENIRSFYVEKENLPRSKLIGFEYCSITQKIHLAFESGELFQLAITEDDPKPEYVARVNSGLRTMRLSPDHEIITLVSSDETVIVMTSTFHVIVEVDLITTDFGDKQFVNVGWGKKETQFHGSEGKAAAKSQPLTPQKSETDDGLSRISWRGDGTLFVVSFLSSQNKIRQFKVFNREGVVQYTSEVSPGLEDNLAWKPSGNLIAVTQRFPNKHVISFFEKNGLKHREFTLPFGANDIFVKCLQWSSDSDILAIHCVNIKNGDTQIQLWTENNYHWYLKQTIKFSRSHPLLYFTWSVAPRSGKTLLIFTEKMLFSYTFCWTVNHSRGINYSDKAVVGVIDGYRVLATAFRLAVIPPPMAHRILQIDEAVNEVVFAPRIEDNNSWINSNAFFSVLSDNRLAFYKQESKSLEYEFINSYEIEWSIPKLISDSIPYAMHHFLWYKPDTIVCCLPLGMDSHLCVMRLEGIDSNKIDRVVVEDTHMVIGLIEHMVISPNPEVIYMVADKSVITYSDDTGVNPTEIRIDESCCQMEVLEINNKHIVVSLSERNRLYIDGNEIANNITSFFVHTEFLLLTTLQHTLVCVSLDATGFNKLLTQDLNVKPWLGAENEKFISGLSIRRVERGSKLITAVGKDTRTILQLPRGNLECIQPRALSLHILGTYLNELNYYAAFDLIRKQRINLNLIHDHDSELFLANAEKFVDDMKEPNWLSLFLSELQEEDVTRTMYSSCYPQKAAIANLPKAEGNEKPTGNKIEKVCELLRNIMESRVDSDCLLLPILTSLVKKHDIKDLEAALRKLKVIKDLESQKGMKLERSAEDALKYLLYLVDVNTLFDIALGMYDFDLVMFIASKSQKDPKEYIPFLNNLKKLEGDYMRYSIDAHLKRFESALRHISKCTDRFNECVHLVKNQNLYSQALKLFDRKSKEYREIARIYADHLTSERKYAEAAIMFSRSDDLESALNAFKLAGDWQEAIIVAKQMKFSAADLHSLYRDLVSRLKESKKYQQAVEILMHYLQEPEDAVAVLCEGKLWQDALTIAYHVDRLDIIETHVKPGIEEHARYMIYKLSKDLEDFVKFRDRLIVVRAEKALKELPQMDADGDYEIHDSRIDSDLYSDTSSIAGSMSSRGSQSSRSSGRSYRSSKNRRKHERKLYSLREGSIYEDIALINALYQSITDAYAIRAEINSLGRMLLHFYNDSEAEKLQTLLAEYLHVIDRSKAEIWPDHLGISVPNTDSAFEGRLETGQVGQGDSAANLLKPHLRYPPIVTPLIWQLDILSPKLKVTSKT